MKSIWFTLFLFIGMASGWAFDFPSNPTHGKDVVAIGRGYDLVSYTWAKDKAFKQLKAKKATMEGSLPPTYYIDWKQIRVRQLGTTSGYSCMVSQVGVIQNRKGARGGKEINTILEIFEDLNKLLEENYTLYGCGWTGNVTRMGPKCNEVHDHFYYLFKKYVRDHGLVFEDYEVATCFNKGWLPNDLAAHVYICIREKSSGKVVIILDPWRNGCVRPIDPKSNPNGKPDQVSGW